MDFYEFQGTTEEIKEQIFIKEIIKIFDNCFSYKKETLNRNQLKFEDFRILHQDGNFTYSTMKLNEFYLSFSFATS